MINHDKTNCPLQLFTESQSGTTTKGNIVLGWDASNYELSNFSNTSTGFLTTVRLDSDTTGALPVTKGGTALTSIAQGSVMVATAANTIGVATPSGNGKVLISNSSTGYPAWATLTEGTNITINESAGGLPSTQA